MTTPNISTGVVEHNKPKRLHPPGTVFRFEAVLGNGSSITTPIFDTVPDGRPLTEVEIGALSVVPVPSKRFEIFVLINTTAGMRLSCQHVQDNGNVQLADVLYILLDQTQGIRYSFVCPGRRCNFRLQNSPLGPTGGAGSDTRFEISVQG